MESGGKAVTKRYCKKITVVLSLVLPIILLFAILNCFTTYVFYEDYKYKMNLMTDIAAKEEFSGLDAVSEMCFYFQKKYRKTKRLCNIIICPCFISHDLIHLLI